MKKKERKRKRSIMVKIGKKGIKRVLSDKNGRKKNMRCYVNILCKGRKLRKKVKK